MPMFYADPARRLGGVLVEIQKNGGDLVLKFGFDLTVKEEVKVMEKARWNPSLRAWTVLDSQRNQFAIDYLMGKNPFAPWNMPLVDFKPNREKCFKHQVMLAATGLTRHYCIWAAEMGSGKTLASIELLEASNIKNWWYVAPKAASYSVQLDYAKWQAKVYPRFMTYEEFTKVMGGWTPGQPPPIGVIFDEASRLKNPSAKRTQAAQYLANNIREYYGDKGYVILMTGTPAPKSPLDWWSLAEIARPGFLREGTIEKFKHRVSLVKMEENAGGVKYPRIITFLDDSKKCSICGRYEDHEVHKTDPFAQLTYVAGKDSEHDLHNFKPSRNEVELLYGRLKGLATVVLKKDCLDLPEKVYRQVELKPSAYMKQLAKSVKKSTPGVAQAMIRLRELSDGFQYHEKLIGTDTCTYCNGTKIQKMPIYKMDIDEYGEETQSDVILEYTDHPCTHCSGKGFIKKYESETVECDTPKVQALKDELDLKEEDGRIVVYGGFTGSIDRICRTVVEMGWSFIRVDGRGWNSSLGNHDPQELLRIFQRDPGAKVQHDKVAFIGHPGSAGMGLTLTASDTIVYYSNDFNAESRIQSEDRIHRPGSRGANIVDFLHLPIDQLVLDNLKKKRDLQKMTMNDFDKAIDAALED
jgi:hypothetical protein